MTLVDINIILCGCVCSAFKKNANISKFLPACVETKILSLDHDRSHDEGRNHARILVTLHCMPCIIIRHFMNKHCGGRGCREGGGGGREPGRIRAEGGAGSGRRPSGMWE